MALSILAKDLDKVAEDERLIRHTALIASAIEDIFLSIAAFEVQRSHR